MSGPGYQSYRDSGIEWLGAVPSHWRLSKLRYLATFSGGGTPSRDNPKFWGGTLPWVSPKDMKAAVISDAQEKITELGLSESSTSLVPPGALLMVVRSGILQHTIPVAQNIVPVALNQDMKALRFGPECQPAFFMRWVQGLNKALLLAWAKQGATVESIEHAYLADTVIPLPPVAEQIAIAAFLDRETGKIDALVEAQRRLIELLKEKRQSVISHAVTKGLDPTAPMKDSGVEWLGEVPARWEISQSRRLFAVRSEPALPQDEMLTASQKHGVLFQSEFVEREGRRVVEVIMGKDSLRHVEPDDFIISMRSFQGGLEWSRLRGCTSFHYVMVTPIKWVHAPFFAQLFKSLPYIQALRSTTDLIRDGQEIRYSHFVKVPLPVVPVAEQQKIADYLKEAVGKVDSLLSQSEIFIALLQERRSALISAAVTGKIDLRGLVPEQADAA